MANLETLELTINANAEGASKGLNKLINSLSALSDALVKPYSDLCDFNAALKELKTNANIKFSVSGKIGSVKSTAKEMGEALDVPESKLDALKMKLEGTSEALEKAAKKGNKLSTATKRLQEFAIEAQIAKEKGKSVAQVPQEYDWGNQRAVNRGDPNAKSFEQWKKDYDAIGERIKAEQAALGLRQKASIALQEEIEAYQESGNAAAESGKKQGSFVNQLKSVKENLKDAIPKFKLFHRIMRIAFTMLVRMGLKALFKGMKEGFNNYYQYAQKVGGSFAKEMDGVYSAWNKLKNQMGASLAPVLSAAIPVLNSIASAAIRAFNAISQLFALLAGKNSWSQATDQVNQYSDAINSAGGGGSKLKEMLAQFDELNVIASESGGGGGGGSVASDFEDMFQEMYEFDKGIRDLVKFIKDNMESIKGIAVAIGVAILAWKLADAFQETLPLLSKIFGYVAAGAVVAITLQITWMLTNQYLNTGNEGWLIADIFTTAVGATAAAAIAQHFIGGNAGAWTASITLAFSAYTGIKALLDNANVSALSKESIITLIENALKVGAAAAVLFKTVGGATAATSLAGGGIVAITVFSAFLGLKTAIDPNIGLVSKEFITTSILTAAATGLGVALLAGSWAIGAGVALTTLVAYIAIKAITSANNVKTDDSLIHLTEEQVEKFVKSKMFSVDPDIMIEVTGKNIKELESDEASISEKISEMLGTLNVVHLGLASDDDYKELKDQITGNGGLIDSVVSWIEDAEQTSKLVLKFTPKLVGSSEEEQNEWYTGNIEGWETVKEYVKGLGKELADLMVDGEGEELKGKRLERVNTLIEETNTIASILAGTDIKTEALIDFELKLKDLDNSSLNDAFKFFDSLKEDMKKAAIEMEETAIANQQRMVVALEHLLKLDPNNAELQAKLKESKEALNTMLNNFKDDVDATFEDLLEPGKSMLQEWLNENFNPNSIEVEQWTSEEMIAMLKRTGFEDVFKDVFKENGIDLGEVNIKDFIEVGGWDLLTQDMKDKFMLAMIQAFGAEGAIQKAKEYGINISEWVSDGLNSDNPKVKAAATKLMKEFGDELNKDKPTVPDVDTPKDFGNNAKDKANNKAKEIATKVKENKILLRNMGWPSDFGTNARNKAVNKAKGIATDVKKQKLIISDASTPSGFFTKVKDGTKSQFGVVKTWLGKQSLKAPTVQADSTASQAAKNAVSSVASQLQSTANANPVKIPVGVKPDGSSVTTHISGGGGGHATVTMMAMAKGGILRSGTLFFAGEAGPEIVGTMNGQTAVANQNQIVDGIRKGVYDAQSEQNGLLREQNTLLRAILAKDGNPRASAALGRIASQSIGMYNSLVGG